MRKLKTQLLLLSAVGFLAMAIQVQPAWAGDADCPPNTNCAFFGGAVQGSISNVPVGTGSWAGLFSENVYLDGSGTYTYVFDLVLTSDPGSAAVISNVSTGLGASALDFFDNTLNWGVIFGVVPGNPFTPTSAGVDDTLPPGFAFTGTTLQVPISGLNTAGQAFEFYAQSKLGPGAGQFNMHDGGNPSTNSLDPGPEPESILLFGTGLLMFGVLLRRRLLPQVPQQLQ